jgi:hypothetical protein
MRAHLAAVALLALAGAAHAQGVGANAADAHAAAANAADDWQVSGAVGSYRVGLDLLVQNGRVTSGRYFYVSQLKDIPLRQVGGPDPLTLQGADGSTFHLHYVGNGSEHGAALGFDNSVGLAGRWTQGAHALPVKLSLDGISGSGVANHRYSLITQAPDSVVEGKARQFLQGVLSGDRSAAAAAVSYPLRVNEAGGRHLTLRDRAALLAHWDAIFTPAYLAVLKTAVPHDMFVRDQGAAVANGAVWFDDRGASSLNLAR